MANTRTTMGEQACLDALVADTLTSFEDDTITKVGKRGLLRRTALTNLKLSACKSVMETGLSACSSLTVVDMLGGGKVQSNAFSSTSALRHVIMRGSSKTTCEADALASSSPLQVGEGAFYVQDSLLNSYKADSMWNRYVILPISAYPATTFETITDSWADIATACANGTYSSKYTVGDVKSIVIDGTTYYMQLVAKDADVLASDGTTTVPTTWLMYKRMYTEHRMHSSATTSGMWAECEMRSWLASDVLPMLPSDVQSAIKTVRKYTGKNNGSTTAKDQTTDDKLWIPSYREVLNSINCETLGAVYAPLTPDNSARIKYGSSGYNGKMWWLRSSSNASTYCTIGSSGSTSTSNPTATNYCTCFGFCI